MDLSFLLDCLNKEQREVVTAEPGNMLVLAGAGSGKTRVLIHRIGWHITMGQADFSNILAVTFTNKAANEMRTRVSDLLKQSLAGLWMGTFHGLSHRFLRRHWQESGLLEQFQILDSGDQKQMIRRVIRELNLDEKLFVPLKVAGYINARKDEGKRPDMLSLGHDYVTNQMIAIYRSYQQLCDQEGLVDFSELLLRTYELFKNCPAVSEHYRARFKYIFIDEFQDTNWLQYRLLRLLAGQENYLFAVGDDDQSIYGWRGARVENMQQFEREYDDVKIFRLERNYRSTKIILAAANELIENNRRRLGKKLLAEGEQGDQIALYRAYNEKDEAAYVVKGIQSRFANGVAYAEHVILYRTGSQSRVFEEALLQAGVSYKIYGGMRFYERAEVKDLIAYLRLSLYPHDNQMFERIVNMPPRGIGKTTMNTLREFAQIHHFSLWEAARGLVDKGGLSARATASVKEFLEVIVDINRAHTLDLRKIVSQAIHSSGLIAHHTQSKDHKAPGRVENLQELLTAAKEFNIDPINLDGNEVEQEQNLLAAFLNYSSLDSGDTQSDEARDNVNLMTLHSAKGLEFDYVYMVGMEEELFPHHFSCQSDDELEEERRLCYVGITRTKIALTMTFAERRRYHGAGRYPKCSRFIREIPPALFREVRLSETSNITFPPSQLNISKEVNSSVETVDIDIPRLGQRVFHHKFGEGVLIDLEGEKNSTRAQVNFAGIGNKWLILAYANLKLIK